MSKRTCAGPFLLAAVALFLFGTASCSRNPVSGVPEVSLASTDSEREVGRSEMEKLAESPGFVQDAKLHEYVKAVVARLAQHSPRRDVEYVVNIMDSPEANAFALPGGYVFITRGILPLFKSEDELANVLGHEIGHVAARHAVQRATAGAIPGIATGLSGWAVGIVSPRLGRLVTGVGGLASGVVLAPYSRHQEREADEVGQKMAAAAGWDPAAMSVFLARLGREAQLKGDSRRWITFLDTHPSTEERVRNTAKRAAGLERSKAAPIAGSVQSFYARLDGVRIGDDPGAGVFVAGRFLHPALGFSIEFPQGWETHNAPRYVAAKTKSGASAAVLLEAVAQGGVPDRAAGEFEKETKLRFESGLERLSIGGLKAVRAEAKNRRSRLHLTWIAYGGQVYQITGMSSDSDFKDFRGQFAEAANSFRPLTEADRSKIRDTRLRIVRARKGETIEAVQRRTGSAWTSDEAAVANGVDAGAPLRGGELLKMAVVERYAP